MSYDNHLPPSSTSPGMYVKFMLLLIHCVQGGVQPDRVPSNLETNELSRIFMDAPAKYATCAAETRKLVYCVLNSYTQMEIGGFSHL